MTGAESAGRPGQDTGGAADATDARLDGEASDLRPRDAPTGGPGDSSATGGPGDSSATERRGRHGHRRVVRRGNEREQIAGPSQDEAGPGWGERDVDSNDDRLRRDVPPHYGRT